MPCHPAAIYEALAYLLVLTTRMWFYWRRNAGHKYQGLIVGTSLMLTFIIHLLVEAVKLVQESWEHKLAESIRLDQGQLLNIPFILISVGVVIYALRYPVPQAEVERLLVEEIKHKEQVSYFNKR